MSDPELEDLLRRYRPAGPPPDLRARIVAGPAPVPRTWPWAAAAAALLAMVCVTQLATRRVYHGIAENVPPAQGSVLAAFPVLEGAVESDPLLEARLEALAHQEPSPSVPAVVDAGASWR